MTIIDYFVCENKQQWLERIAECDWRSGKYLCDLLKNGTLFEKTGENTKVLLLTNKEELLGFCTVSEKKYDIESSLSPWLGFVYVFPKYRGNRYSEKLLRCAEEVVCASGVKGLYLSTKHIGLYEKYGYSFLENAKDWRNEEQRVCFKPSEKIKQG